MLHVSARTFRNVLLATTLVTVVAAPAAAGPASIVPAAGTADTPVGAAAAKKAGQHRSYSVNAHSAYGSAHAAGVIEVTETHVSVEGTLENRGRGQAWMEISIRYSEGSRDIFHSSDRRGAPAFRTRQDHPTRRTKFSASGRRGRHITVKSIEVEVCHGVAWWSTDGRQCTRAPI